MAARRWPWVTLSIIALNRASDLTKDEIAAALAANGGKLEAAAKALQVSARALTMAARRFALVE